MKKISTKLSKELLITLASILVYGLCITAIIFILIEFIQKSAVI